MEEYYKLYKWVVDRKDLTPSEKIAYSIIDALNGTNKRCYAGDKFFAERLNMTVRGVKKILHSLEQKGFIIRDTIDGKRVIYTVEENLIEGNHSSP